MIGIKIILLPTDGSACSRKALAYALSFAKQYGSRLVALHVLDLRWEEQGSYVLLEMGEDAHQRARKGYEEEAQRTLKEVGDAAATAGVTIEPLIVTGVPFEEILGVAKKLPADLIIMGTHGRTGVVHALLGSVAERIVRRAPCPVLTVRQEEHDFVVS
ncbi:MAG TPA: universal stress protein [Candidatus Acidoferrum sp.]|nr:universal stress protein [Candidatus Acidoferrum sp.]